jgi:hypothetical protein
VARCARPGSPLTRHPFGAASQLVAVVVGISLVWADAVRARTDSARLTAAEVCAVETMKSLQKIGTGIEAYMIDHGVCPDGPTMPDLALVLTPTYLHDIPLVDAWGTPFRYLARGDRQAYVVVSAGSDKQFDTTNYREVLWEQSGIERLNSTSADIVFRDGRLVRRPICQGQYEPIGPR